MVPESVGARARTLCDDMEMTFPVLPHVPSVACFWELSPNLFFVSYLYGIVGTNSLSSIPPAASQPSGDLLSYQQRALFYDLPSSRPSGALAIHSDWSRTDEYVGCAAVMDAVVWSRHLHPAYSVSIAELIALNLALDAAAESPSTNFIIYSDSMAALLALSQ